MSNEVFISYCHKDIRHLAELRQFLAPFERECGLEIWDDQRIGLGTPWEIELDEALKRAKVAVLIVTANFMASSFIAQAELPVIFRDASQRGLKILWIAASASAYQVTEIAKYQAANDPARPLDTMSGSKRRAAWVEIAKKIFDSCQTSKCEKPKDSRNVFPRPSGSRKSILLAQTTDDVSDDADQVRSYLEQYDDEIAVFPTGVYPQGGEAFRTAFEQDLAQAQLFIQLLGRRAGRVPPDLPEGYTRWQLERARAVSLPIIQWRHPEIDTKTVEDSTYRKLLTSETVVASGLEAFKRQILNWARTPPSRHTATRTSTVFINADEQDLGVAKEVERECVANALTAILPMTGPSSEVIRKDLAETLIDCDLLVFIYGNTTQDWIRSQLRFFNKVRPRRECPPRLLAICSGPPPKPDIGMSIPNAHLIDCLDGWNLEPIRSLIAEYAE